MIGRYPDLHHPGRVAMPEAIVERQLVFLFKIVITISIQALHIATTITKWTHITG